MQHKKYGIIYSHTFLICKL